MSTRSWAAAGFLAALGWLAFVSVASAQPTPAPMTFTAEQAARGQAVFQANCQACHGATLGGGPGGPPLTGAAFRSRWQAQAGDALFAFITQKMPPGAPGSISGQATADVVATILKANGAKPGGAALPASAAELAHLNMAAVLPAAPPVVRAALPGDRQFTPDAITVAALKARAERLRAITPVTDDMLRHPPAADWLTWRNTYESQGFSSLDEISRDTVAGLQPAWSWQLASGPNEITPLVHDGVVFVVSAGRLEALDAASGDLLWRYSRPGLKAPVRNLAIYGELIYFAAGTNMVALDVHSGQVVWDHPVAGPGDAIGFTGGPLAAKGKIFQGMSSCSAPYPGGCYIVALDAKTGQEAWRFNTIARPGQPGGDTWNGAPLDQRFGGSVWTAGSYDPDLDLIYFGAGQTYKAATLMVGRTARSGSNAALFTDTTLALRPDTGELVWHYQHLARDIWDLDWAFERTLATLTVDGRPRRTITTAGKMSIFDTLDAATGQFLFAYDAGLQNIVTAIDPKTGAKTISPQALPAPGQEAHVCPSGFGGRDWPATAFNPRTGVLFIPLNETCTRYKFLPGDTFDIVVYPQPPPGSDGMIGRVQAVDMATHKTLWTRRERAPHASAILATAGGVIFEGGRDRWFKASDDRSGKVLWQVRLDGVPSSYPVTYSVDGVQYVAVTSGGGNPLDSGLGTLTPEIVTPASGTTLWVFRLPPPAH